MLYNMSLIQITEKEFDVILDIRYATKNNVCGCELYSRPICYVAEATIDPLKHAIKLARDLGLKIKIFDGYRPFSVQKFMANKFNASNPGFVSDPATGSTPHCRGVALDLTLVDKNEKELETGTDFDEFSKLAYHRSNKISLTAQKNRLILLGIMTLAGFDFYSQEWWHYQLFEPRKYPIIEDREKLSAVL